MKKIINLIIIMCTILLNYNVYAYTCDEQKEVNWKNDESLKIKDVDLIKLFRLKKGVDIANESVQGLTVTDKHIVISTIKSDADLSHIYFIEHNLEQTSYDDNFIGIEKYKIVKELNDKSYGHANDLAYNKDNNEVAIPYSKKNSGINKFYISTIDLNDFTVTDHEVGIDYYGIAYQNDKHRYIVKGSPVYILNNDFQYTSTYTIPLSYLVHQGMSYYDKYLFFSYFEHGSLSSSQPCHYNSSERYSNLVVVYDISDDSDVGEDKIVESLYISNKLLDEIGSPGELENTEFTEDGEMILVFNRTSYVDFYKLKYKSASLNFNINLLSDNDLADNTYTFKLMDENNNIIEEKKNVKNKVVFDTISIDSAGIYNYKIVNENNNEVYDVKSIVKGNPLTLSYEEYITYDGNESLNIEVNENNSYDDNPPLNKDNKNSDDLTSDSTISSVPNTFEGKNVIFIICGIILVFSGSLLFIKSKKSLCKTKK